MFHLTFKHEWLTNHPWHVYNKELDGSLCKACVLFDKSEKNRGIFVKNVFQKVSKREKILLTPKKIQLLMLIMMQRKRSDMKTTFMP